MTFNRWFELDVHIPDATLHRLKRIKYFSIYTLRDFGDLSNLIGSLSRTIQQYSPPSEWIMCELGFFPVSVKNAKRIEVYLWPTNLKTNVCRNHSFQVNRKKNATGIRLLTSSNQAAIFVSTSCEERHNKLFLAINLASQQKTTKLYFSSQVRKQFKLLTVLFQ